jgi:hypothetical protein
MFILKIKSSINYPENLYKAIKLIQTSDAAERPFNQIVLDILARDEEVKNKLREVKKDG